MLTVSCAPLVRHCAALPPNFGWPIPFRLLHTFHYHWECARRLRFDLGQGPPGARPKEAHVAEAGWPGGGGGRRGRRCLRATRQTAGSSSQSTSCTRRRSSGCATCSRSSGRLSAWASGQRGARAIHVHDHVLSCTTNAGCQFVAHSIQDYNRRVTQATSKSGFGGDMANHLPGNEELSRHQDMCSVRLWVSALATT